MFVGFRFLVSYIFSLFIIFFLFFSSAAKSSTSVPVGLLLDSNSNDVCISMAVSDFYSALSNYTTRLSLFRRNYSDSVGALSEALDLLKNVGVHAILSPRGSPEAGIISELGRESHVPIISSSAITTFFPSVSGSQNPYLFRTTIDVSYQVKPIVDLVKAFGWYEIVVLLEDTDYGNAIIPSLTKSLQDFQIRISDEISIKTSAKDSSILETLKMLKRKWTRVFVVHMSESFGSRFLTLVNRSGMMEKGYAWIVTDGLSNSLNSLRPKVTESMQGVLGIRPYVPDSEELNNLTKKWRNDPSLVKLASEPKIYCLWEYDAIWALAFAAERIGPNISNASFSNTDLLNLKVSESGPKLKEEIKNFRFKGLSGEFNMVDGKLQPGPYEIINLIGTGIKPVGFWSPRYKISRDLIGSSTGEPARNSTLSSGNLRTIIWPGDSFERPRGWDAVSSTGGNTLKIGVPYKRGFPEFVGALKDPFTNKISNFTGFSIEVFKVVWNNLTYKVPYEFERFSNKEGGTTSYDELVCTLKDEKYDIAVGDITIRANRTGCADFTLPYTENGITMVVKKTQRRNNDMWIFVHPLSWDLWITIMVLCLLTGVSIIVLERNGGNAELHGSPQRKLGMIFWFPFQAIVIPQRDLVVKNCSRFVLVIWLFFAFILMQSYTANLSSILVVDQLKPSYPSIKYLREKGHAVGYQNGSFVEDFLVTTLKFDRSKLKAYACVQEYHKALSDGPQNGGVAAIFDEIPYLKIFLAAHGSDYAMGGATYPSQGFGMAFPKGSPLVSEFSKAILNVYEGPEMTRLTKKYFGNRLQDDKIDPTEDGAPSLTTSNFGGLFILVTVLTVSAIVVSETYVFKTLKDMFSRPSSSPNSDSSSAYSSDAPVEASDADPDHDDALPEVTVAVNDHLPEANYREPPPG